MISSLNKSHKYENNCIYTECSAHIKMGLLVYTVYKNVSLLFHLISEDCMSPIG